MNTTRNIKILIIIIILIFRILTSTGQHYIDIKNEKFPGVNKLTVMDFNGCCEKNGYQAVYYFDINGNPIKASYFFKKKRLADYEFKYNTKGFLTEESQTFNINEKKKSRTTKFFQKFGSNDNNIRDSIADFEEIRYNEIGDIIYSCIPALLDKETGKMKTLIGGRRYSVVEEYEYIYDCFNRWIEKYVIFDNKKLLLEKRIYK